MKAALKFAGKSERKVAAVFGVTPQQCHKAVAYLSQGQPGIPIYLFTTRAPDSQTASLCEKVIVEQDSLGLLVAAEKELWPNWVALSLATWTGEHGKWPVKLAPFLIPPFRALLMNEQPDFFPATHIKTHAARRAKEILGAITNRAKDINRGLWLLLFSQAAQWSAPISRKVFRRNHGTEPLAHVPVRTASTQGGAVLTLHYGSRSWNHKQLTESINATTAEYIHLQQHSNQDSLNDLLPLFDRPDTFAVSRQANYQLWHPTIIPTAPFRQLQPGTTAATLAPISPTILFHREKLQALGGLPDTIVPGSALRLLFWKSAAAGWASYSGGGTQPLEELSDEPYEEAEFAVRILSDPNLKALGPQDPDLKRGNITTQIRGPATYSKSKPRILIASPYLPYPLSHGGAVRIYNLCKALSSQADLLLATFRESADHIYFDKLHEVFREVYVLDIDEKKSKDKALPHQVRGHISKSMRALIAHLAEHRDVDLLQVEFTHLAHFRDAAPKIPAILVEHDLTFTLYEQLALQSKTAEAQTEYQLWKAFEQHWLKQYEAVWTMSDQDRAQAIEAGSPRDGTYTIPNGVDTERFCPLPHDTGPLEVFYVGSFRHLPNILGYERLRHEIMPQVWSKFPQIKLRVVAGPDPQRYWKEFQRRDFPTPDSRIEFHAFVEDLRPLYAKATIVVIPLIVSAGTNIKVLEAMACRKAVVSTPIGCAGLGLQDGYDVVIRKDSEHLAAAICDLLADPKAREAIATNARQTAEQRFSWNAIAAQALASYREVIAR